MENKTEDVDPFELFLKERIHNSWHPFFKEQKDTIIQISNTLSKEKTEIFPSPKNIFRAFTYDLNNIKVVILGQDPYHTPSIANGLAFSVNVPHYSAPSLRNIVNSIEEDFGESMRITEAKSKKDYRKVWGHHQAEQGVMLLNTALTVQRGMPNSHRHIWPEFIKTIVSYLDKTQQDLVWVLWGNNAIKLVDEIAPQALSIKSSHPSPLSCNKPCGEFPAFCECRPFFRCNDLLDSLRKAPIEW